MSQNRRLAQIWMPGLTLIAANLLSGCALWEMIQSQTAPSANAPAPTPASPSSPSPQPGESPFAAFTAPPLQPQPTTSARENYGCITANYFADITWQQDQPQMSFGRKPAEAALRDTAAQVVSNPDGSFTYAVAQEFLYYVRVYPDRTCLIQVVNPTSNTAAIEEVGRLGGRVLTSVTLHSYQQSPG